VRLERLRGLLRGISQTRIIVAGDFFLDQYWLVDPALQEISLETGLPAHQIAEIRLSPGAAGTVANNLSALGVSQVKALGVIGDDGNGLELRRGLGANSVQTEELIVTPRRLTPVYTKPINRTTREEMERFDIKNRGALEEELENLFLEKLKAGLPEADGVAILDQVQEEDCGVITKRTRKVLMDLARRYPRKIFLADSRTRILEFRHVLIKPNQAEASEALSIPLSDRERLLRSLAGISEAPVFMTSGAEGIALFDGTKMSHFPALPISTPIDVVGAGDSVSAAIVSGLCAGADFGEAAQLANLVASVTIRKIGTTGTASPREVMEIAEEHRDLIERWPDC